MHRVYIVALSLAIASTAHADTAIELVHNIRGELGIFVAVGIGFAMVVFIFGMIGFLAASGDQQAHDKGRQRMIWGIIALFFMVSIWGIVNVIQIMFRIDSDPSCSPTEIDVVRTGVSSGDSYINECL